MQSMGKFLVLTGLLIVLIGGILMFSDKIPLLGKLPGDIRVEKENVRFYFPITTSIVISVFISVIFWILSHFRK